MVEKRWRAVCERENEASAADDSLKYTVFHLLPSDSELVSAFVERKRRYNSYPINDFFIFNFFR